LTLTGRLPGRLGPKEIAGFLLDLFKAKEITSIAVSSLVSLLEDASASLEGRYDVDTCKFINRRVDA